MRCASIFPHNNTTLSHMVHALRTLSVHGVRQQRNIDPPMCKSGEQCTYSTNRVWMKYTARVVYTISKISASNGALPTYSVHSQGHCVGAVYTVSGLTGALHTCSLHFQPTHRGACSVKCRYTVHVQCMVLVHLSVYSARSEYNAALCTCTVRCKCS